MPDGARAGAEGDPGVAWTACMRAGDFAAAWRLSDAVLAARDASGRDDPALPYHRRWVWDGTPPDGQDVLVRCYHGLGDTLQFARFLPAVRERAASVTLECQAALCGLLAGMAGVDRLVAFDPARPRPRGACDMEVMELGHVLRVSAAEVAAGIPYVAVPAARLARGRARAGGRVALCWRAGGWDPERSVDLGRLLGALAAPGRRFVSLQRGPAAIEAGAAYFDNPGDDDGDVVETAALICGAEAVVTVDTMVAHLAGALGRAAVLLVKDAPDWRWPVGGGRCVWYPALQVVRMESVVCGQASRQGAVF